MGHQCCGGGGDVRETGVLGEEDESLNGPLELLIVIVEGQEGTSRKAHDPLTASGIWNVNRKVLDDVACDFGLPHTVFTGRSDLILMCA